MIYFFYLILSFMITLLQTVILTNIPLFNHFYDLFLVIVLYIGLFRPISEGLPIVLILGLFVDGISGSPFWVYTTTYLWFLIIVKWVIQYFDAGSTIILPFAIAAGVLLENSFFIVVATGFTHSARLSSNIINIVIPQIIWAVFTGPFIMIVFKTLHEKMGQSALSGEQPDEKTKKGVF